MKDWMETFSFSKRFVKIIKVLEVMVLILITATISTTLPLVLPKCKTPRCFALDPIDANQLGNEKSDRYLKSCNVKYTGLPDPMPPITENFGDGGTFNCMQHDHESVGISADGESRYTNVTYNELSTLTYTSQDAAINHLLSRGTHKQYAPEGKFHLKLKYFSKIKGSNF